MSDDLIERLRDAVGPYADRIIHSLLAHEAEISRLRAEVERLRAALADERTHADALAELVDSQVNEFWTWWDDEAEKLLAQHRARRQG